MKSKFLIKFVLPFLLVIALSFSACERNRTEVAQSGRDYHSPVEYSEGTQLALSSGDVNVAAVAVSGEASKPDGEALFIANCAACHQGNGQGVPAAFPPLDKSPYVTGDKLERLAAIMIYGLKGKITVLGQDYNGVMAPLGNLKDAELAAIATYIRSSWSNKAGPVEEKVFTEVRAKYGDFQTHGMFEISQLGEEPS